MLQLSLGTKLEQELGHITTAVAYICAGLCGNIWSALFLPSMVTVGASGALFGLMGMALIDIARNPGTMRRPRLSLAVNTVSVLVSLFVGFLPLMDNYAHIFGLAAGLLLGCVVIPRTDPVRHQVAIAGAALVALFLLNILGLTLLATDAALTDCGFCRDFDCPRFLPWCITPDSSSTTA
eukprot:TRINITY_DN5820_c0_g1_i2.p3 TRINITY_DN5820_c0_g1~~TRINITY_DN5820_c0_g1_i2.p3  ORF type:complete len:180 (-),score=46.37 TRINITY_DN5820_c0_g1_i2:54-593(-)